MAKYMRLNSERLCVAIAKSKMSLAELSRKSGLATSTISTLKSAGRKGVFPSSIGKLADALGVSVEYLMGEE